MAIAAVVGGADPPQIHGKHAGGVGPVDQRVHAVRVEPPHQLLDRKNYRRGTAHVIEHGQPRSRADAGQHRLNHFLGRGDRHGNRGHDYPQALLFGHIAQHVAAGVVVVVGDQQLIAGLEAERTDYGVDGGRDVGQQDHIVRVGPEERGQGRTRFIQQRRHPLREELDWPGFQRGPQLVLRGEDVRGQAPNEPWLSITSTGSKAQASACSDPCGKW